MGLQPVKTIIGTGIPVFQDVDDVAMSGFTLDTSNLPNVDVAGAILVKGTVMGYDENTRLAKVVKTAELYANATNVATTYQVKKGHLLQVGNIVANTVGGTAHTITGIDTSNAAYDVITLDVTLGVALNGGAAPLAGDVLFQSSAAGAAAAAFSVTPKGLLYAETNIASSTTVSVVLDAIVYERRIPSPGKAVKALLPATILFSQSL